MSEIRTLMDRYCLHLAEHWPAIGDADWEELEGRFGCRFTDQFVALAEAALEYEFPGELMRVGRGGDPTSDSIVDVCDAKARVGDWPPEMIPIYSVGNGDYSCLNVRDGGTSGVYYRHHEDGRIEHVAPTIQAWLAEFLPAMAA